MSTTGRDNRIVLSLARGMMLAAVALTVLALLRGVLGAGEWASWSALVVAVAMLVLGLAAARVTLRGGAG